CTYLRKREAFFSKPLEVVAAGEEELLGYYLLTEAPEGGHDFVLPKEAPTHVAFDEGFWDGWLESEQRQAKANADRVSYSWDALIEKFTHHFVGGTLIRSPFGSNENLEP